MSILTWYAVCAVIGGTILLIQFVMTLIGMDDVDDVPDDAPDADPASAEDGHTSHVFGVLSFRTIVAAITFFGLTGLAMSSSGARAELTFVVALAAGVAAMYGVWWLMQLLVRLKSDGTARVERAIGKTGTVYLRIPGARAGQGKVTVNLQNRTVEYRAVTDRDELPTGASIVVTAVVDADTVEVQAVPIERELAM